MPAGRGCRCSLMVFSRVALAHGMDGSLRDWDVFFSNNYKKTSTLIPLHQG